MKVKTSSFWGHTLFDLNDLKYDPKVQVTQNDFKKKNLNTRINSVVPAPLPNDLPFPRKELSKLKQDFT